ncbi:MAG: hypothetical protein ACQETH_02940 [Candidatus Rifleibacteriota bacterium]
MNRFTSSIIASIVTVAIIFFIGRLLFLSDIQKNILQVSKQIIQIKDNTNTLNQELNKLKKEVKTYVEKPRNQKVLIPGNEPKLLSSIIKCSQNMRIQDYEILPSYFVKGKNEDSYSSTSSQAYQDGEELPPLDENGMPIGIEVDDGSDWPGVEIIPVKFRFITTYRNLGQFFSNAEKYLPMSKIKSLDLILKDSGIAKGTLVMLFPASESN